MEPSRGMSVPLHLANFMGGNLKNFYDNPGFLSRLLANRAIPLEVVLAKANLNFKGGRSRV